MSEAALGETAAARVAVAVPVSRHAWVRRQATLHYAGNRLVRAEGIDLAGSGPLGVTGTLYVVKDSLCRDNRSVMRVERQKVVNGRVVEVRNWGEVEDAGPQAA